MNIGNEFENTNFSNRNIALNSRSEHIFSHFNALAKQADCAISDAAMYIKNHNDTGYNPDIDLIIIDFTSNTERPYEEISNISSYLQSSGVEALIWTDMENLEVAYAGLPISQCHFVFDGNDLEALLIMSGAIRRGTKMDQLHDNSRDNEFGELHRISDELADFARKLARFAEHDKNIMTNGLAEKPVSFRPATPLVTQPFIESVTPPQIKAQSGIDGQTIREMIKLRRKREEYFDATLFADPAWDILLDLLAAKLESKFVSVSSLCIAASVPATTALRWITGMTESGMLVRRHDPNDARRVFIELSEDTMAKMLNYFAELSGKKNMVV